MQNTTVPTLPSTTDVTATIPATATGPVTTTATTTTTATATTTTSAPCAGNVTQSFEYLCLQPTLDGLVLPANELPGPPYSNATVCHIDRPSQFVSQQVEYKIASQGPFLNVSLQNSGPSMGYDCCGVVDECSYKVDGAVGPNEILPELYGVFSSMMELYCANVDDECNVTGNIYKIENTDAQGVAQIGQITVDGQIFLCPPTATRCLVCTPGVCNYECPASCAFTFLGLKGGIMPSESPSMAPTMLGPTQRPTSESPTLLPTGSPTMAPSVVSSSASRHMGPSSSIENVMILLVCSTLLSWIPPRSKQ